MWIWPLIMAVKALAACQTDAESGLLARHRLGREEPLPAGSITGVVVREANCVWLDEAGSSNRYLLLWPKDYRAVAGEDGSVTVTDGRGTAIAASGREVQLGGGEYNARDHGDFVASLVLEPIPEQCKGPLYWLVTWPV